VVVELPVATVKKAATIGRRCQFPLWDDKARFVLSTIKGEEPPFCGKRAHGMGPYCAQHRAICFTKVKYRAEAA
jgi:hypothetical protein